jgi:hypothetical protein
VARSVVLAGQITSNIAAQVPVRYASNRTEDLETYVAGFGRSHPSLELSMNLHLTIGPLVSLMAGIFILVLPRLLNYIVAIYLIVIGLLGLFGNGTIH